MSLVLAAHKTPAGFASRISADRHLVSFAPFMCGQIRPPRINIGDGHKINKGRLVMKRIIQIAAIFAVLSFIFAAPRARAQGARHDGEVQGEQGIPVAGATIVVCTQPANVTIAPCTPLANLYTDTTLTTPAPNPLTTDGLGNFYFYAAPGLYTVQVYGPSINTYTTPEVLLPANPTNAQFGSITALTLNLGGNLAVGRNASVTGTLTAGSFAANLAASSNAQLKGTGVVLYVDTTSAGCGGSGCSDSNDGKSLGSAMATIDHALCSLPTGNCANQIAGNGTVYFSRRLLGKLNFHLRRLVDGHSRSELFFAAGVLAESAERQRRNFTHRHPGQQLRPKHTDSARSHRRRLERGPQPPRHLALRHQRSHLHRQRSGAISRPRHRRRRMLQQRAHGHLQHVGRVLRQRHGKSPTHRRARSRMGHHRRVFLDSA
jgi:hypothetical protein